MTLGSAAFSEECGYANFSAAVWAADAVTNKGEKEMATGQDDEQSRTWEALYALVRQVLQQHGQEDYLGRADYHVLGDNYGLQAISVAFHQLGMLRPSIIGKLQALLAKYPDWEIFVAIDIPGKEGLWPRMGLRIRAQEIIDELKRQHLPQEFQNLTFAAEWRKS